MEAYAQHTYNPSNSDELGFQQGDVLKILNMENPDWLYAEFNGYTGIIPGNYVSFRIPLWYIPLKKAEAVNLLKTKKGSNFAHPEGCFLVRPSEQNPNDLSISVRIRDVQHFKILRSEGRSEYFLWRSGPMFSSINELVEHYHHNTVSNREVAMLRDMNFGSARAQYDFTSRSPEELTIYQNDVITVIRVVDSDWSLGQLERDGKTLRGIYPTNYAV